MHSKKDYCQQTIIYQSYSDDVITSGNQSFRLPHNYRWIHDHIVFRIAMKCLHPLELLLAFLYCRFFLNAAIVHSTNLNKYKNTGFFLYGNHTQTVGDAFIPTRILGAKRCSVIVSPANLGIPIVGKLLPLFGVLPTPDTFSGMKTFNQAIHQQITAKNCVVIYPEAHVWPWYTRIRPYPATAFSYPVQLAVPAFCMTTTYQKKRFGKRPKITIYIDGPFYPDSRLSNREQKEKLRDNISQCMNRRSLNSTFQYIHYEKGEHL